ncbi:hypothetical protein C8A05DRAFT_15912 [Staphylotrichum tortipilum]|uniref:FAD-binding FR-type domain-containing protein n=1 Tax=Staphylotrichum tortipilum TaxID=2831512 RepID=A0AAN6RSN0_9PEZI|nr:hypothetical protein C8A05DRAFT_15912 [Staphylotrichum longicolle]
MAPGLHVYEYFAVGLGSLIVFLIFLYFLGIKQLRFLRYALAYLAHVRIPVLNYILPEIGGAILYHSANAAALGLEGRSSSQFFAIANLALLYLGGRTNLIADWIGISFRTYYLAHYSVAVAVVALSLIHTAQAASSGRFETLQAVSGGLLAGFLCLCLVSSIVHLVVHSAGCPGRYTLFRIHHLVFSICILIFLGWHLWTVSAEPTFSFAWVMLFVTGSLWVISTALRLRMWHGYRGARMTIQSPHESKITRLSVDTGSTVPALPGSYFYVNVPGQLSGVCVPVAWWTDDVNGSVRHFDILMNREMRPALPDLRPGLSGPYGGDLSMGSFETVVLAGEGIGIAGILPFALSLISRKKRDKQNNGDVPLHCDITRYIDLVWKLDDNRQYDCAAEYFHSLAETLRDITPQTGLNDPDKQQVSFLRVFVIYPERAGKSTKVPKLPALKNWNAVKSQDLNLLSQRIEKVANGKPGRTLVVASGTRRFMNAARTMALQHSSVENIIWFRELSYRPDTLKHPSRPML